MIRLRITDDTLAQNPAIQEWLETCESLINAEIERKLVELLITGACRIGDEVFSLEVDRIDYGRCASLPTSSSQP